MYLYYKDSILPHPQHPPQGLRQLLADAKVVRLEPSENDQEQQQVIACNLR